MSPRVVCLQVGWEVVYDNRRNPTFKMCLKSLNILCNLCGASTVASGMYP